MTPVPVPPWMAGLLPGAAPTAELLASRRGVTTLALSAGRQVVVKAAEPTGDGAAADRDGVLREHTVLTSVPRLCERFAPALLRQYGRVALVMNRIVGQPAFRHAGVLVDDGAEAIVLHRLRFVTEELAVLHGRGWCHGDLQPGHVLDSGVLLDHGSAQSARLPLPGYRGGMVHFVAPELAAAIETDGAGSGSPAADVFALGAVVAHGLTGAVVGRYSPTDTWAAKVAALARGDLDIDPLRGHAPRAPQLVRIVEHLLAVDPGVRPADGAAVLALLPSGPDHRR